MKRFILGSLLIVSMLAGCAKTSEPMETLISNAARPEGDIGAVSVELVNGDVYFLLIQEHFQTSYPDTLDEWKVTAWQVDDHVNAIGIREVSPDYEYDYLCWNGNEYEFHTGSLFSELGISDLLPEYSSLSMYAGIKGDKLCIGVNAVGDMTATPITRYVDLSSFGGCTMEYSSDMRAMYTVDAASTSFTSHSDPIIEWGGSLKYTQDGKKIHISCKGIGDYFCSEWMNPEELNGLRLLDATYEEKEGRDKASSTKRIIHGTEDDYEYERDRVQLDSVSLNLFRDYPNDSHLDK